MSSRIRSIPFLKEYEAVLKNITSSKLSLGKKYEIIKDKKNLWDIDVFEYTSKDDMKFVQQELLTIWDFYLTILTKPDSLSADVESSLFKLLIRIICRHEYKLEYLCKFESSTTIVISSRGSAIIQQYRQLLARSRLLCSHKMSTRLSTNEECDFCGCVFAVSFIRENEFQKPVLQAIHKGFDEWYTTTLQINSFRGIHNIRLHRTLLMILKEMSLYCFDASHCRSLNDYFAICNSKSTPYYRGLSISVKKKPIDLSFTGIKKSISLLTKPKSNRVYNENASSDMFYGNTNYTNTLSTETVLETIHESESMIGVVNKNRISPDPITSSGLWRSDSGEKEKSNEKEELNQWCKLYRRESVSSNCPPLSIDPDDLVSLADPSLSNNVEEKADCISSSNQIGFDDIYEYSESFRFSGNEENVLKFEMLNPSIFLWKYIYEYIEKNGEEKMDLNKENWYESLVHNGNVYITFVNYYHQYINSISKGDIVWYKLPGYMDLCITVPLMVSECKFQNRCKNEEAFYLTSYHQYLDINKFYSASSFRLRNLSSDSHPILQSVRILPKYNPHIAFVCIMVVFNCTNPSIPNDVMAYLSRCKEIMKALHQAKLSYYQNARERCVDEYMVNGVITANADSMSANHANGKGRGFIFPLRNLFSKKNRTKIPSAHSASELPSFPALPTPPKSPYPSIPFIPTSLSSPKLSALSQTPQTSQTSQTSQTEQATIRLAQHWVIAPSESYQPQDSEISPAREGIPHAPEISPLLIPSTSPVILPNPPLSHFCGESPQSSPRNMSPYSLTYSGPAAHHTSSRCSLSDSPRESSDSDSSVSSKFSASASQSHQLGKRSVSGFQEQVETSLFNLSRVVALLALQVFVTARNDHKDILTSILSTVYELPSIVSAGDFHIFINTTFFGISKYIDRFDVSTCINGFSYKKHGNFFQTRKPILLCSLFCHWCDSVRDYLHKLLVYKIVLKNENGLTLLQRLLIDAFSKSVNLQVLSKGCIDYIEIGKVILQYISNKGDEMMDSTKELLKKEKGNTISTRLSLELDVFLFPLFFHQYKQEYNAFYKEPNSHYLLDSVGRYAELIYRAVTDPYHAKAPDVLNMVFSDYEKGTYL